MKNLFTEDFTITIEVKRHNGETWVRALVDGVEAADEGTMAMLMMRALPGIQSFAWKHIGKAEMFRPGGDGEDGAS